MVLCFALLVLHVSLSLLQSLPQQVVHHCQQPHQRPPQRPKNYYYKMTTTIEKRTKSESSYS
jgi:hypothetical protein